MDELIERIDAAGQQIALTDVFDAEVNTIITCGMRGFG
jgi:hypothetical protein